MNTPITYEEWCLQAKVPESMGMSILLSDKIRAHSGAVAKAGQLMGEALARGLDGKGCEIPGLVVAVTDEPGYMNFTARFPHPVFNPTPDQYLSMAHSGWVIALTETDRWRRMSLWGYLRAWWRRQRRGIEE